MDFLAEWLRRLWYLLNRRRLDEALRLEMEAHREMLSDPRRFGNTLRLRQDARDVWGWEWLDTMVQDLRFARRSLRRTPSFTVAGLGSLALGFTLAGLAIALLNAYSIQALPYESADRLYHVRYAPPGPWEPRGLSGLDWTQVRDVVEFPIAARNETLYLPADAGFSQPARGLRVNPGFAHGMGLRTVIGRSFVESDFHDGGMPVTLIGYSLWRNRYSEAPSIVGRSVRVEVESTGTAQDFRVVGVLPTDFYFGRDSAEAVDFLIPSGTALRAYVVRLREGVPHDIAARRITEAVRQVASDLRPDWSGVQLESVHDRYVAEIRPVFSGVLTASGLVLVLVCANLAVLIVLRLLRRQKEIAVRAALGCSRWALTRMLLIETIGLTIGGCAVGLVLSALLLKWLAPQIESQLGRHAAGGVGAIDIDGSVLSVLAGVAVLISALLALVPLTLRRQPLGDTLRAPGNTATNTPTVRVLRSTLIAFEVAGALVLLVSCGVMVRSVIAMVQTDFGFRSDGLMRGRVVLRAADYADSSKFFRFYQQFGERVAAELRSPFVFTNWPPFFDFPHHIVETVGVERIQSTAGAVEVGAGYFTTLGIALRAGRDFEGADTIPAESVAIISESLAKQLWPDGNVVDRVLRTIEQTPQGWRSGAWRRVVGVAADVRQTYDDSNFRDVYLPRGAASSGRFGIFYVRSDRTPRQLWDSMRQIAADLDPHAVIDEPKSVESQDRRLAGTAFIAGLLSAFATVAALIALVGIYGITAYAVQQREREIAIRMAMGAARHSVIGLFLREGGVVIGAGLIAGLAGAVAAARLLTSHVFGVTPFDPLTIVTMSLLLGAVGLFAILWPAKRASTRNPLIGLREG